MEPNNSNTYGPQGGAQSYPQAPKEKKPILSVPVAILIGMALIAGAIIFKDVWSSRSATVDNDPLAQENIEIKDVTEDDHILGDPNADIVLIEYSDFECPYCKQYHPTLKRIIDEYGPSGKVAWVYRHFPLYKGSESSPPLHANAGKQAEASECVAEIGGNAAFWKFTDRLYEVTPGNNRFDMSTIGDIAAYAGVDKATFQTCLDSGKYAQKISDDYFAAIEAGAQGTPYTILIKTRTGEPLVLDAGAVPYPNLKGIIDAFIAK
jgi:protein-disulfide isomerase